MKSYLDKLGLSYLWNKIKLYVTDRLKLSSTYEMSSDSNSDLQLESGDTFEEAFGKLEKAIIDDEYVTAQFMIDINENKADKTDLFSGSYNDLTDKPNLATVATSGSYNDLTNKPTIPSAPGTLNTTATTAQSTNASEALSGSVTLHKVSKTGSYNDLLNKPTIPAAQIQSDWNQSTTTSLDYIKNKPDIYSLVTTTVPNVTSAGTASTWSFALGTGDNAHTLMINGSNSTVPTLGTAKTVATGGLQSSSYGLYGKPAGGSTR